MNWETENNVISKLYVGGENIIYPWGFETADSSAFFSLEKGIGYRYEVLEEKYIFDEKNYHADLIVKMKEGQWKLTCNDKIINDNAIERKVELICLEDSYFMDFVIRFRFKKEFFDYVEIAGQRIFHKNTNVYHQYPTDHILLKGKKSNVKLSMLDSTVPSSMAPFMYARDKDNEWVVHVRMLPQKWDKEVIKLCNRWAQTRPIPQCLSRTLLHSKRLRQNMWYRGERLQFKNIILKRINPNAFPMVKISKGTTLMWHIKMEMS